MVPTPSWYSALAEFSYVFHTVFDVLFILVGFAVVAVVSRPGWRQHLRWASPAAAAAVLTGLYRLAVDLHHYLRIGTPDAVYLTSTLFNFAANVLSFYSAFMLWKILRGFALRPATAEPLAETPPPGVWPPPPTRPAV